MKNRIEIYQIDDGQTQISVNFDTDTIWLTQLQMAELFDKDIRTVNEHIKNIYKTKELVKEGKRNVTRNLEHFNLDMIISVGYRVNSKRGVQFRQWATQRLKDFLVKGYAINEKRLEQKKQEVIQLKTRIQILSRAIQGFDAVSMKFP